MKQKLALVLTLVLLAAALSGCAGTTVVVGNCTCPPEVHVQAPTPAPTQAPAAPETTPAPAPVEGALKTGLAVVTSVAKSTSATADENGAAKFDVTLAAVTVDGSGVIRSCRLDSVGAEGPFDASGNFAFDPAPVQTKNELGEAYGMKAYAGSQYEWNEQAEAVASYAVGKTVDELKNGAVDETGHAADADLATTATIYIGGYVDAIIQAAETAQPLGAQNGDALKLVSINTLDAASMTSGDEESLEVVLAVDVAVLTMNGDTITSCLIDSLQAPVKFDRSGAIVSDITAPIQTKNELGEAYGMKAYAGSQYEWNEQAANFSAYVTGKTPADVAGIAVSEGKATDADLASGVTIAIGGFQALIAKAAQ